MMNDGGPAFPSGQIDNDRGALIDPMNTGMSLRDWFAGQALSMFRFSDFPSSEAVAQAAYQLADAMLKETSQ